MTIWRTLLGGIIGLLGAGIVISFVTGITGISVPEFLLKTIMVGFIGYGCYKGFVKDLKKYKEKHPIEAETYKPSEQQSSKEETTLSDRTSRYIKDGEFQKIYKTCVELFSTYSDDKENYVSYSSQYYLDTKSGKLIENSVTNRDPFSIRLGSITSSANYISYEKMHSAIDGAKDFAEDLDKEEFRKLTKSNWKEWVWENIEKKHAIEVLDYLGKETVAGQESVDVTWKWLCREYESKKYIIVSESKTWRSASPNLSTLQEDILAGTDDYFRREEADVSNSEKIRNATKLQFISKYPITANLVRAGVFNLDKNEIIDISR